MESLETENFIESTTVNGPSFKDIGKKTYSVTVTVIESSTVESLKTDIQPDEGHGWP